MKKLGKIFAVVVAIGGLSFVSLVVFQEKFIFLSETLPEDYSYNFDAPFKEITLTAVDGAHLNALHFTVEKPVGIVLYFHGNAGNLSKWGNIASQFTNAHYEVLIMDYRGYGKSTGERSEERLYKDAELFYNQAKQWHPESRILVFGRSLGTTFATYVASKNTPRKLILESPFYSLEKLVSQRYPFLPTKNMLRYTFDTARYIDDVSCHITIIHGTDDGVVPINAAEMLYRVIPERQKTMVRIKNGKHNDLGTFQEYGLAIRKELAY